MIRSPAARPSTSSAPSVNRAQQAVMVRMHDGEPAGRVSADFAERLLMSGVAQPVGRERLRYLRLEPNYVIARSSGGWELIEEARRKHGDAAVRRGILACDHQPLKYQPSSIPAIRKR